MGDEWRIMLSGEVERWYAGLSESELAQADQALDRLTAEGITLGMPHNRYLSEKLWELRFRCGQVNQRITRARKALRRHQTKKG